MAGMLVLLWLLLKGCRHQAGRGGTELLTAALFLLGGRFLLSLESS